MDQEENKPDEEPASEERFSEVPTSSLPKPFDASLFDTAGNSIEEFPVKKDDIDSFQTPTEDFLDSEDKDLFKSFTEGKNPVEEVNLSDEKANESQDQIYQGLTLPSMDEGDVAFSTPPQSLEIEQATDSISLGEDDPQVDVPNPDQRSNEKPTTASAKKLPSPSEIVLEKPANADIKEDFSRKSKQAVHSSKPTLAQLAKEAVSVKEIHTAPIVFQSSQAFTNSSAFDDDPFISAIATSEVDRQRDAWIPNENTKRTLTVRQTSIHGSEFVNRAEMTMPGIVFEDPQVDPLKELLLKHQVDGEATKRSVLTLDQVTRDVNGLKKLLDAGCLRSGLYLSGLLLTSIGQGKGQTFMPSQNTAESLQIWFTRIALLVKLHMFTTAEQECKAFGALDKPDMFYEYYPDLYPGRKGTMVPFGLRVLVAEVPQYASQHQESLTMLYQILHMCKQIISNLSAGLDEYGNSVELSDDYRNASLSLWKSRETRVEYSVGNCLLSMKDYDQAVKTFEAIAGKDASSKTQLISAVGRVYLQLGDLNSAQNVFNNIESESNDGLQDRVQVLMNRGFLNMAQSAYTEAHKHFKEILTIDSSNFTAINNACVCLLYMGQLKSALSMLESLVFDDPATYLDESILFNLCTLYELESSKSTNKKQNLLFLASKHRGDGFNVNCLKMS